MICLGMCYKCTALEAIHLVLHLNAIHTNFSLYIMFWNSSSLVQHEKAFTRRRVEEMCRVEDT